MVKTFVWHKDIRRPLGLQPRRHHPAVHNQRTEAASTAIIPQSGESFSAATRPASVKIRKDTDSV